MPNHITSRLTITGEAAEVAKVFAFIKADEPDKDGSYRLMDLNKIVPMPEELDIESSSLVEDGADYLLGLSGNCLEVADFKQTSKYQRMAKMEKENPKMFEQAIELGRKKLHNIANYGHGDWYSWRICQKYLRQTNICDGIVGDWICHVECQAVARKLGMYDDCDPDYGLSDESFGETINEYILDEHYDRENDDIQENWQGLTRYQEVLKILDELEVK